MSKIVYKMEETGEATNLRPTPNNYILESGETEIEGDRLPEIETLHEKKWKDYLASIEYRTDRVKEYPAMQDYLDGVVKNDQAQIDKYISDCKAVKSKFPKPE